MEPASPAPEAPALSADSLNRIGNALLHGAADAIVYSGKDGLIGFWNAGAERIFGFTASEAVGRSLDIIIPERQRDRHWQGYDSVMATGESRYGKGDLLSVPALHKDGRRISVEFTIVPVHDEAGAMIGMAAILRDATGRFEELKALRRRIAAL